ncbi:MAG: phage protease [Deltaproteobacteria bacterium]|nr:phage protease [Deltaproteobacteria bacterium]
MAPPTLTGYQVEAEIFSVGEWNGEVFTLKDLQEIARNFEKLKHRLKPPLKFGHDERQTLLGQKDGDPALGWVESLRVVGDRLMASFQGVPSVVYQAIRSGRYRRVSAEIYFRVRQGRKTLGKALKAVALLGADLPAVQNLQDLSVYLTAHPGLPAGGDTCRVFTLPVLESRIVTNNQELCMNDCQNQALPGEDTGPGKPHPVPESRENASLEELRTELEELRAFRSRHEKWLADDRSRRNRDAFQEARRQVLNFCEEQVHAGRLAPALKDTLLREADRQARSFVSGEGLAVPFEWVRDFVQGSPVRLPQGESAFSSRSPEQAETGTGNPSQVLAHEARRRMNELNISYSEAASFVLRNNQTLARAYREYTMNPITGA